MRLISVPRATPSAGAVYCTEKPLGNPGAECAELGLLPQGTTT